MNRTKLRAQSRVKRQALNQHKQHQHAKALLQAAQGCTTIWQAQHVACYRANDGEINPLYLVEHLWDLGKNCYLPIMLPQHTLNFVLYERHTDLKVNAHGIDEPIDTTNTISVQRIHLIFLPLVAFDQHGTRLGRGGGYYDRALVNKAPSSYLVGLAHECQKVDDIKAQDHDIALDCVVTEQTVHYF